MNGIHRKACMSLDRYLKDEMGFRKYIELMEGMATNKRQTMMETAKAENKLFVETAEKYLLTFDRITKLPTLELAEVLGAKGLKVEMLAVAILSVEDLGVREKLLGHVPRPLLPLLSQEMKDRPAPKPYDIGAARLQLIRTARELEKQGKLESMQIPRFDRHHFTAKAA